MDKTKRSARCPEKGQHERIPSIIVNDFICDIGCFNSKV